MISGRFSASGEAEIKLTVRAPQGIDMMIDAVIDTGFSDYLTLSPATVATLQLPFRESVSFELADGSRAELDVYRAEVLWDDSWRGALVTATAGGTLVGMRLLDGNRLTIDCMVGGAVTIEALAHVHEAN